MMLFAGSILTFHNHVKDSLSGQQEWVYVELPLESENQSASLNSGNGTVRNMSTDKFQRSYKEKRPVVLNSQSNLWHTVSEHS